VGKKSSKKGYGVIAQTIIESGTLICEYAGNVNFSRYIKDITIFLL